MRHSKLLLRSEPLTSTVIEAAASELDKCAWQQARLALAAHVRPPDAASVQLHLRMSGYSPRTGIATLQVAAAALRCWACQLRCADEIWWQSGLLEERPVLLLVTGHTATMAHLLCSLQGQWQWL